MATPTYTAIASITLGSSASSVTFSSIPQDYRDLVLVIDGQQSGSGGSEVQCVANGDTTNSYSQVRIKGSGSSITTSAFATNSMTLGQITRGFRFSIVTHFLDYSATDKHKSTLGRANNVGGDGAGALANRYASTSAINSLQAKNFSGEDFNSGSTFALYGIEA